jgi:hypothetical protein
LIREAAEQLMINYSTAKTILRVNRLKKRILRVNKEKKFEIFKVVHPNQNIIDIKEENEENSYASIITINIKVDKDLPNPKPSSSTLDTVFLSQKCPRNNQISQKITYSSNYTDQFMDNILKHTEFAKILLDSQFKNNNLTKENESSKKSLYDQHNELLKLLNIYSNIKREVELNSQNISNMLNFNLNYNWELLSSIEAWSKSIEDEKKRKGVKEDIEVNQCFLNGNQQ